MIARPATAAGLYPRGPATVARLRRHVWFGAYSLLVVLPLLAAWLTDAVPPRSPLIDVSVGFGLLGLSLLLAQLALVSRLRPASRPFGADVLMQWHRGMGIVGLTFVLAHAVFAGAGWSAWNPFSGANPVRSGTVALWVTGLIVVTSVLRQRLRLSYEAWQVTHLAASVVITGAALWHVFGIGRYASVPLVGGLLVGYAGLFVALLVRYRVVRPFELARQPWEVVANADVGGSVRLVTVRPVGHGGFRFEPGQFAWFSTGSRPMLSAQHPLSIASTAVPREDHGLEFAIKALGDWSAGDVPALAPGRRVWVDGPYGGFTPSEQMHEPIVLIAGGIGIAPFRSILMTLRDQHARRRVYLFYAASDWTRLVFADELADLSAVLDVHICYVFESPDPSWRGERGFVIEEVLTRHLPAGLSELEYFVCGPLPMIDALERALTTLGVPPDRLHTERFQMV